MKNKFLLPTLAILGTVLLWGMSFVSSKAILNTGFPPMTMVFLRFILASILLYPILKKSEPSTKVIKRDQIGIILSGLFGVTVYFYFEATGVKLTSASNASMIIATIPVFTLIIEFIFFKGRIPWYKSIGVFLSVIGVYFITIKSGQSDTSPQAITGNLLMLGACLCWVAYNIISRTMKKKYSGLALTTYQCIWGAVFLIPLTLLEYNQWIEITIPIWLNLIYLGIFCSAVSYFLYIYALTWLGPVVITSYLNLIPVISVIGGIFVLGEKITSIQIIGGLIIIAGVFVINWNGRGITKPS